MNSFSIRHIGESDKTWIHRLLTDRWGSAVIVTRGKIHRVDELSGFTAVDNDHPVGLIMYRCEAGACEIVSLDSLAEGCGIGSALLKSVEEAARENKCSRVWLVTTNDNLHALRFYQRRGYVLAAVYRDAINTSRQLKPEIPMAGNDGIPLRDEIELEKNV